MSAADPSPEQPTTAPATALPPVSVVIPVLDEERHLADVAVKTKQEKITSVNFVPPLIKPWDYDPEVVRSTVAKAIAAADAPPGPKASTTTSATGKATSGTASPTPRATKPAVMERPGTDPDANTTDLGSVCAAG